MSGSTTETASNHRFLIIVVVIALGALLFAIFSGGSHNNTGSTSTSGSSPAPASLVSSINSIPTTVFDAIGSGTATGKPLSISAPALTSNGKPEVLYEGAEYCPYCATERWAMAAALARFGSFTKLGITHSSTSDVYPDTQTLSFYHSEYSSSYISFTPLEIYTNIPDGGGYTTLQTPTEAQANLINKYDATPYLPSDEAGSIPFIDFGGRYLIAGATYDPALLQGLTQTQIASDMTKSSSAVAKGADGAANDITAAICSLTNNQPATACDQTVQEIEKSL